MAELDELFSNAQSISGVTIIYGKALVDSDGGEVRVQIGEAIEGVAFDDEDAQTDALIEMDDLADANVDEDYEAEQPYESDDEGADSDPEDVIAEEETNVIDSEEDTSTEDGDAIAPEVDEGDPLTVEVEE